MDEDQVHDALVKAAGGENALQGIVDEMVVMSNLPREECGHCGERPTAVEINFRTLEGHEPGAHADRYLCQVCATAILVWI